MALTATTVGFSRLPLSEGWHTVIGLGIAAVKASLVILFFMHVLYSARLTWLVALSGLLWLAILIGYTITDYMTRAWNPTVGR
jgi:cytochrome c oxidase subunit 4